MKVMKRLSLEELSKLLDGQMLSEELQLEGRVAVKKNGNALFDYKGKISLEPVRVVGENHYSLKIQGGFFYFDAVGKFKVNCSRGLIGDSKVDYRLVVPIDLSEDAEMKIDQMSEIKY